MAQSPDAKRIKLLEDASKAIAEHKVVVISKSWCPYCRVAIQLLQDARIPDIKVIEVDHLGLSLEDQSAWMMAIKERTGEHRVPQLFVDDKYVGEYDQIVLEGTPNALQPALAQQLAEVCEPEPQGDFDFDLFVLGGGSGGCAAALSAAGIDGLKVAVADYVEPSPAGTTWGVGGTCVNVGCIPKKLLHIAATMGDVNKSDAAAFGWDLNQNQEHSWKVVTENVQRYIKSELNQGMLDGFEANGIAYFNNKASLADRHTVALLQPDGSSKTVSAKYIILAAGGRPNDGGFPGAELCITSDDLFWLKDPPGKTLVVGAAYIALECGGMLTGMGCDVTVHVRSILLRGFDRECVDKIGDYMAHHGTKFAMGARGQRFVPGKEKKVGCHFSLDGKEEYEEFDTVLLAIGRKGEASKLGLQNAGVWFDEHSGKVPAPCERTNVPNIFCIGDLIENRPELTPVAKVAGKKVVKRLFAGETAVMNYSNIATTVFTPLEYGMVGLTEDQAREKFGAEFGEANMVTKVAKPLEWTLSAARDNDANKAFFKVLMNPKGTIVGFHMLGPNAGEVLQGMALAIKAGATKDMLDETIGIHPTTAETMTMLSGQKIKGVICES